ncbi:hypothetical protein FB567DRAFT_234351 [Paraphoma chrysanthemicola]|uniref:Uncharacterized protein n=1 Tax=Paraphoma chrysanthemicola TaxID=798071 RepID=A0A8K0RFG2_9PLEO|nr:hypothetical protein FB567DRAFT_234351 [Paraphoma chrysanthemicola]
MPSPFHQKYSSQSHKVFGDNTVPAMPEAPKQDNERRGSDSSITSGPSSPTDGRRRSSTTQRFGNLHSLKRPEDEQSAARRQSLHDSYGKVGFVGTLWNNFTRGPVTATTAQKKEPRDTTTLRG